MGTWRRHWRRHGTALNLHREAEGKGELGGCGCRRLSCVIGNEGPEEPFAPRWLLCIRPEHHLNSFHARSSEPLFHLFLKPDLISSLRRPLALALFLCSRSPHSRSTKPPV